MPQTKKGADLMEPGPAHNIAIGGEMSGTSVPGPAWAETIRDQEHLYDGELAEALREGKATPEVRRAYRAIVTNAQIIAYLQQFHPELVTEAEVAVARTLGDL